MSRTQQRALPFDPTPSRLTVSLCLAALGGALLLNLHHLAWWAGPLALLTLLWRGRAAWHTHRLPGRLQRVTLVVVLTAAVIVSFRGLNGVAAGATLLAAMSAAKLTETRQVRDWYIVIGTALFLLVAACLDAQPLWRLPLYAAQCWLLATALRALGSGRAQTPLRQLLRDAGRTLLIALPFALLLFLFFPRLPGGFWALPAEEAAISGLSDEMSPGSISRLMESDQPALRVRFEGPLPPPQQRYWRGPVMHDFDGFTWRRRMGQIAREGPATFSGSGYTYDVTLEPNNHNVLIALELPQSPSVPFARVSFDQQLLSSRPIDRQRNYRLTSYPDYRSAPELSAYARGIDLRLPQERNPRTRQFAQQLRAGASGDDAFIAATLDYFRANAFEYTLTPQPLHQDSVDDFLFNTRQGFCGHYASAFVNLMRAGGVPARVVTGYLGGEWNSIGGYLTVRQSHAHAWAEVWLPDRGWTRVDPTAVVAPERITRDIYSLLGSGARSTARALREVPGLGQLILSVEALNAWWQDSVVGFNARRQSDIFEFIGFSDVDLRSVALLLGGGSLAWFGWLLWTLRERATPLRPDALARLWRRLERRLTRAGLPRAVHEGPLDYAARVGASQPTLAGPLQSIAREYAALRFGPGSGALRERLRALRQAIDALDPRR